MPNNDMPICRTPFRKSLAAASQYKRSAPDRESQNGADSVGLGEEDNIDENMITIDEEDLEQGKVEF